MKKKVREYFIMAHDSESTVSGYHKGPFFWVKR